MIVFVLCIIGVLLLVVFFVKLELSHGLALFVFFVV